jgi:hypothetical protein
VPPDQYRGLTPEDRRRTIVARHFPKPTEEVRRLNIRSSRELDAHVEQAQKTITGIEPQTIRDSNGLRQMVENDFSQIEAICR